MKKYMLKYKKVLLDYQLDVLKRMYPLIKKHIINIELFVLAMSILRLYVYIPYLNVIITPTLYQLSLTILAIFIFSIQTRTLAIGIIGALFASMGFALFHNDALVEVIANLAYFLLSYVCLRLIMEMRSKI